MHKSSGSIGTVSAERMFPRAPFFENLFFFFFRIISRKFRNPKGLQRSFSNVHATHVKHQKYASLSFRSDLSAKTLVFNVEGTLLKSHSLFPYFMLVAFEAGSLLRALLLFLLYPFICLVGQEMGLKIMVMVCFFGMKKESFRAGSAVLPKFFLDDVGLEAFEELKRGGRKVAVSDHFPRVMIESFLREYLEVDCVFGRELKTGRGYFLGLMEEKKKDMVNLEEKDNIISHDDIVAFSRFNSSLDHPAFSHCKEIYYLARRADKKSWQQLPRDRYPKPLIFHDGRLVVRPTPMATLALFMWVPFGFVLALIRAVAALSLPHSLSLPTLSFTGLKIEISKPRLSFPALPSSKENESRKGLLYVCNHRTLLDPLSLSFALKKNSTAVTYSLSRLSEILSPIRTVRLTRDREQNAEMMERLLNEGDLVVCPEGTACREPYLLRFSPLFAEMSDEIVPVALDTHVSMFYGTTAGGLKCLDPLFFLMNPRPGYTIQLLDVVSGLTACQDGDDKSRFDIANYVQSEIGKALSFECTKLTRRDKYLILAGNEGITSNQR